MKSGEFLKKLSRENKEAMDLFEKIYQCLLQATGLTYI